MKEKNKNLQHKISEDWIACITNPENTTEEMTKYYWSEKLKGTKREITITLDDEDYMKLLERYAYVQSLVEIPENIYAESYDTIEDFIVHLIKSYLKNYCCM